RGGRLSSGSAAAARSTTDRSGRRDRLQYGGSGRRLCRRVALRAGHRGSGTVLCTDSRYGGDAGPWGERAGGRPRVAPPPRGPGGVGTHGREGGEGCRIGGRRRGGCASLSRTHRRFYGGNGRYQLHAEAVSVRASL